MSKIVKRYPPKIEIAKIRLYLGIDMKNLNKKDSKYIVTVGNKGFTHDLISDYDPIDYAGAQGDLLLTYPLRVKKHTQRVQLEDGSTKENIPSDIKEKAEKPQSAYYLGYELPQGWYFGRDNLIFHRGPIIVSEDMLDPKPDLKTAKKKKKLFEINPDSLVKATGTGFYYVTTDPPHPYGEKRKDRKKRYVYLHRALMEQALGRYLEPGEEVHHKSGDRTDNTFSNLVLTESGKHQKYHALKQPFWKKSPRTKPGKKRKKISDYIRNISKYLV